MTVEVASERSREPGLNQGNPRRTTIKIVGMISRSTKVRSAAAAFTVVSRDAGAAATAICVSVISGELRDSNGARAGCPAKQAMGTQEQDENHERERIGLRPFRQAIAGAESVHQAENEAGDHSAGDIAEAADERDGEAAHDDRTADKWRDRKQRDHQSAAEASQHAAIDEDAGDIAPDRDAHQRGGLLIGDAGAQSQAITAAGNAKERDRHDDRGDQHDDGAHDDDAHAADLPYAAERLGNALLVGIPEANDHMLQDDDQAKRDDEPVHRAIERQAKKTALQHEAEQADDEHRRDEAEDEAAAIADHQPGRHSADHQKLAMGEIDDAGQSENQRDADADKDDDAGDRQTVDELLQENIH